MDTIRVTTTRQEGLRPIGTGGQPAIHAYEQLARFLRRTLSEDHARLFAEPNFNPSRGTVDWYTESDAEVVPLSEADPARRQTAESRLVGLRDEIEAKAEELSRSDSGGDRHLGEMLRLALEVPDEQAVYVAGDRPVLVNWGTLRDQPDPPRGVLRKFVPYVPPPEAARPTAAGPEAVGGTADAVYAAQAVGSGAAAAVAEPQYVEMQRPLYWLAWLLWLLFGLLIAAILVVLLSGCGVRLPLLGWLNSGTLVTYCPVGAAEADSGLSPELAAELARSQVLENELRRLELQVAVERRACERVVTESPPTSPSPGPDGPVDSAPDGEASPPATPEEPPEQADDGAFDERLEREGAQSGEISVTLAWDSDADLDLYVVCPDGDEIYYGRRSACGGELDVDMNVPQRMSNEPVENVFWPDGAAEPGTYRVVVENYQTRSEGDRPTPFRVRVVNDGETSVHDGEVHERDGRYTVVEFEVP